MIADETIPTILRTIDALSIELPQVGLAVLHLYDIIFEQTHLKVFLIDEDGEAITYVLDSDILTYGLELGDELIIGSGGLFMLT